MHVGTPLSHRDFDRKNLGNWFEFSLILKYGVEAGNVDIDAHYEPVPKTAPLKSNYILPLLNQKLLKYSGIQMLFELFLGGNVNSQRQKYSLSLVFLVF
jgi:hypothetical protein